MTTVYKQNTPKKWKVIQISEKESRENNENGGENDLNQQKRKIDEKILWKIVEKNSWNEFSIIKYTCLIFYISDTSFISLLCLT